LTGTEKNSTSIFCDLMTKAQKVFFRFLVFIWLLSVIIFFVWWFNDRHIQSPVRFIINSIIVFWTSLMPGYFFFFVSRMKKIDSTISIPSSWRVAMVTTRAPNEPFELVKKTLLAMQQQEVKHDTWLADEDPNDKIILWCKQNNIKLCSRKNVDEYHNPTWPRRTKCKEGNLAYFYDMFGYNDYDFVAQLDADHVPESGYLKSMLQPFVDENIGYVSAPSICDSNATKSWSARGRLYAESILHGPLQAGHNKNYAPLCIGSHYAVRTKALKSIGGLGPELAEDHSTTLMMNAAGWQGAHNIDAIAHGEGPATFADCVTQEFQWSRSLMIILLSETPKYWKTLTNNRKIQFLFAQLWYPVFSLVMFIGFILPIIAVFTKEPFVNVSFAEFVLHSLPINISILSIVYWLKKNKWLRPVDAPVINWESILFAVLRWPWSLYGCVMGIFSVITKKPTLFSVTPKGDNQYSSLKWNTYVPYFFIVIISFLPTLIVSDAQEASGYFFFLILNVLIYSIAIFLITTIHFYEQKKIK
jgi:cellulose synthase (UDP-forming)